MTTTRSKGRRLLAVVALSALVALVTTALTTDTVGLFPPKLQAREPLVAAAVTHVVVDSQPPSIVHRQVFPEGFEALVSHGALLGRVMVSPPVLEHVARHARMAPDRIATFSPATIGQRALTDSGSEERATELRYSGLPYRLEVQPRSTAPIIDIYSQAPSTSEAIRLANAAVLGARDYLRRLADKQGFARDKTLRLRQLGTARGSVVNGGAPLVIAGLTFLLVFALSCAASLTLIHLRSRRATAERPDHAEGAISAGSGAGGDWPRTTRVLPWMLAAFIAILFLVPFNSVELEASLPIDLKFDRLVLPFIAGTWVLALAAGGKAAPRLRLTWIHVAVGAFVACALFSVILNARDLNLTLEWDRSLKELPLLLAYASLFLLTASVVKRTELRAFLNYTLVLAVVCAVGIIWEHRFQQNLFYDWADKLLPAVFSVGEAEATSVDEAGRRLVRGAAELPLEAVAMLSMALPMAVIGLLGVKDWPRRLLYGLAVVLLLAATFATYRKSALLVPISVALTLVYFRRQELLRLAPLALMLVLAIQALVPGALRMTTFQLDPDQLGVNTISDRAVDYDAVRPDLWTHVAFGRGWGSYEPTGHRILDSEVLLRMIEMGVVGLLAFLLVGLSVILSARAAITSRDPIRAPAALAGAAAAVAFLVLSTLFDVLSFPHATYIFLYMAGLVAVAIERPAQPDVERGAPRHALMDHGVRDHGVRRDSIARRPAAHHADSVSGR